MSYDKLNEKIMDMQDEIIKAVQGCVQIDSVKAAPEEGAPYGKGCRAALDYALKLGESLGFKTGNVGNRVGYVEFGEGDEMVRRSGSSGRCSGVAKAGLILPSEQRSTTANSMAVACRTIRDRPSAPSTD